MSGDVSTGRGLPTPGHADFEELAAGYALDALEPEEEQRFLVHLPGCSRCAAAVDAFREVAGQLALVCDPVRELPTPAALTELFLSAPQGLPADPFVPSQAVAAERPAGPLVTPRLRRPQPRPSVSLPASRRARVLLAVGVLGLTGLFTAATVDLTLRPELRGGAEQSASAAALRAVNEPGSALGRLSAVTAPPSGTAAVPAHGTAVVVDGHAWLVVEGLPALAPGQRYVAWRIAGFDDKTASAGFTVRHGGATPVDLGPAPDLAPGGTGPRYAVTVEADEATLPRTPSPAVVLQPAPRETA